MFRPDLSLSLCMHRTCDFHFDKIDALEDESLALQAFDWDKLSYNDKIGNCSSRLDR